MAASACSKLASGARGSGGGGEFCTDATGGRVAQPATPRAAPIVERPVMMARRSSADMAAHGLLYAPPTLAIRIGCRDCGGTEEPRPTGGPTRTARSHQALRGDRRSVARVGRPTSNGNLDRRGTRVQIVRCEDLERWT